MSRANTSGLENTPLLIYAFTRLKLYGAYIGSIIIFVVSGNLYEYDCFHPFALHFIEDCIPLIFRINRIRIVIKAALCIRYTYEVNSQLCSNINEILAFTIDNVVLRSRKDLAHINIFTIEFRRTATGGG